MSLDKIQPLDLAELEALRKIAHLVGTIYFYGGFKAETYNERQLEEILKETGYRYRTEDEVLAGAALRSPRPSLAEAAEAKPDCICGERMDRVEPYWFLYRCPKCKRQATPHAWVIQSGVRAKEIAEYKAAKAGKVAAPEGESDGRGL